MAKAEIAYLHRTHPRSRGIRLTVLPGGEVRVTTPPRYDGARIRDFIETHRAWVEKKIEEMKRHRPPMAIPKGGLRKHKENARRVVLEKIAKVTSAHPFAHGRITIRSQKTRWGSCSTKGNLNFNYKIVFLPDRLIEYVVVHELCHLREFNHSNRFWKLVEEIVPEYRDLRKELRAVSL